MEKSEWITLIVVIIFISPVIFFKCLVYQKIITVNSTEPWDIDSNFYVAREPNVATGDYTFFYFSEFKDNPRVFCVMSQRLSTSAITNGVSVGNKKIDNQTFESGFITWYYDGEKIQQKTYPSTNHIGEHSLTSKSEDFEFVLNGNYPLYNISYNDQNFKVNFKTTDAKLGALKTIEIKPNSTGQRFIEDEGMMALEQALPTGFKYYNTSRQMVDFGETGHTVVQFSAGPYMGLLVQDLFLPFEGKLNGAATNGALYMESVWGRSLLPLEWLLVTSWFENGSHFWFVYHPDMWPFQAQLNRTLHMWFYDSETKETHLFNKFHWKEIEEDGHTKFVVEGENTAENTKVEIVAKVLVKQTNVFQKIPFFLHKHRYIQMPSTIEKFNFYSPAYNRTIEDLGQPAGYSEKATFTGFNLEKEYSN